MSPLPLGGDVVKFDDCTILSLQCCLREAWWEGNGACNSVSHFGQTYDSIYKSSCGSNWPNFDNEKSEMAIIQRSPPLKCVTHSVTQWRYWWASGDRENPCPGCTSSVNGNRRSQALNDSLRWPRMTSCISIANHDSAELPLSWKQGGHVYVCMSELEQEAEYAHI